MYSSKPEFKIRMKKQVYIFVCSLFSAVYCFSQSSKVDSLLTFVKTMKEDTVKVEALNELAREYGDFNMDSSVLLSTMALSISEKQKWKKGEANSYIWLGWCKYLQGDYLKALEYNFIALKKGKEIKNKRIISSVLGSIGNIYSAQNKYSPALDYYSQALKIANEQNNKAGIAIQLGNMGTVYLNQTNYSKALDCYFKALKIGEELGDQSRIEIQLGNIGILYDEQQDYPRALDYYSRALKISKNRGNKDGIAGNLANIGGIYLSQAKYNKALEYYVEALKMDEELGDKNNSATIMGNIGIVYFKLGDYSQGLDYYLRALKVAEELDDRDGIARHLGNIGALYIKTGNFAQAEKYLKSALIVSTEINALNLIKENQQDLSNLYDTTGRHELAYIHYGYYILYRDSLQNEENIKKQTRIEMQYDFDKKETADSIRNIEQVIQEHLKQDQEIKQQKTYTYGGVIGFMLMLLVAGVSFRAFRQKQKVNEVIALQKNLVEKKQKEILDSIHYAKRIQQSLMPTEKYMHKNLTRLGKK